MGWISLPRDFLEQQLDSLGLERNRFETGLTDPDSVSNTERLIDYPDPEEDARCPGSREALTADDLVVSRSPAGATVRCAHCGKNVFSYWRKTTQEWGKATHYSATLTVSESTDISMPSETNYD